LEWRILHSICVLKSFDLSSSTSTLNGISVFLRSVSQRYFINISYDGTAYSGWQIQKNAANTIQQKINKGLSTLLKENIEILGCCRTDAGAHAKALIAHFDSTSLLFPLKAKKLFIQDWLHKANAILPKDISINGIQAVKKDSNARFDATARTYQYFIHNKPNPFLNKRSYYYYSELDVVLMNKACVILKKNKK